MGNIAIIFAVGVLIIFLVLPTLMETIFTTYPLGPGYGAYNGWKEFMHNLGWFYYLLGIPLAAVAYAAGHKLEEGGMV